MNTQPNPDLKLFISQLSGDIYSVEADEVKNLDEFQIPLKCKPSTSCKKCHGRGYTGRNVHTGLFVFCLKCMRKCVDHEEIKKTDI